MYIGTYGDRHGMRMYTTCILVPMGIGMDVHVQYICTYGDRHGDEVQRADIHIWVVKSP